jgi:hypothetical protein
MADFCWDCVGDEFATRNDLRDPSDTPSFWAMCEGCGLHLFSFAGTRLCQRGEVEIAWTSCPACLALVAAATDNDGDPSRT